MYVWKFAHSYHYLDILSFRDSEGNNCFGVDLEEGNTESVKNYLQVIYDYPLTYQEKNYFRLYLSYINCFYFLCSLPNTYI